MCCSVSPGVNVRFSNTVLLASEVLLPDVGIVHVLGYQNKVEAHTGLRGWLRSKVSFGRSGNAMLIPFPAVPRTMSSANVVETKDCKYVLQDVKNAIPTQFLPRNSGPLLGRTVLSLKVEVFEAAGIYTVVLASDAEAIPDALSQVPKTRQPKLNPKLFSTYAKWYPDWTFALCCFDRSAAALADPLLWWYQPMHTDRLFLPMLDSHTGSVPNLAERVRLEHTLAVSSYRLKAGSAVHYRDVVPTAVQPFLPKTVIGDHEHSRMLNGDFVCQLDDVLLGKFKPDRCRPPGAI